MYKFFRFFSYIYAGMIGLYVCQHFIYHDRVPSERWFVTIIAFILFLYASPKPNTNSEDLNEE